VILVMDEASIERLRIAVRVLNLHHVHSDKVTEAEIGILKSYLGGDLANLTVEDVAAAVIRRELNLERSAQRGDDRLAEKKPDKCAHPGCVCNVARGSKYCSLYCECVGNRLISSCDCRHTECAAGKAVGAAGWARR